MRVIAAPAYERQARRVLTAGERDAAEAQIAARPDAWPVIPGSGGARKARIALGGRGRRGGGRLIYFHMPAPGVLVLLAVYAKAAKENLTHADTQAIRAAVAGFRRALAAGPDD